MKYQHVMPFGPAFSSTGPTVFRLWAPGAEQVELLVDGLTLEMERLPDGWFSASRNTAVGTRYAFQIDGGEPVPDPASRYNPGDVHAPSVVVDPCDFEWPDSEWKGRPWEEVVIYEVHIGAFTSSGDFRGVEARLDYLVELGITAIELMPIADFPGNHNWGYDGVLIFSPDASYGRPEELKKLVAAAHERGLMVFLDVVYNHFGPEGNYLHGYAPPFFNQNRHTPWGASLNFDGDASENVRAFFIHNALYWLEEFRFDGLRLDAVHAIHDNSTPGFVADLNAAIRSGPWAERHIHLMIENELNDAALLTRDTSAVPIKAIAQWNDDLHHVLHVLATGETDGYYVDFAQGSVGLLARALSEGFAYQGEPSPHNGSRPRGMPSSFLPATAFISFLQNHDQIGNRAFGERIARLADNKAVQAATVCLLLAPQIPLLFMGEEFASTSPFLYFCDLGSELTDAIREGRKAEFSGFGKFNTPAGIEAIPDPTQLATFHHSKIRWEDLEESRHQNCLSFYKALLQLRRDKVIPLLGCIRPGGEFRMVGASGLQIAWHFANGSVLHLAANLGQHASEEPFALKGTPFFSHNHNFGDFLGPWAVIWSLEVSSNG